ncbi:MAG: hemagglutinin repeat-containing protein [Epsilonproteobacteria bacterium]|nr:hemagglutinin repeat-containing protein [Campylobacterota bacterium]
MNQEALTLLIAQAQTAVKEKEQAALNQMQTGLVNAIEYNRVGEGSVIVNAGSAQVVGSNINANDYLAIKTDIGSIEVKALETTSSTYSKDEELKIGLTDAVKSITNPLSAIDFSGGGASVKVAEATYDEVDTKTISTNHHGSMLNAGKAIILDSAEDITIEGSDLSSSGDVKLLASEDVMIKESVDTTSTDTKETHARAEVSVSVSHSSVNAVNAIKSVEEAKEQLKQSERDYRTYQKELKKQKVNLATLQQALSEGKPGINKEDIEELKELIDDLKSDEQYYLATITAASANLTSKTTLATQAVAGAATSAGTAGFTGSLDLDIDGSKSHTQTQSSHSRGSSITASNNLNITTGVQRDEDGNTLYDELGRVKSDSSGTTASIKGSTLNAGDSIDIKTGELNILASEDKSTTDTKSEHVNAHASLSTSGGVSASISGDKSQSQMRQTTHTNSQLHASNINLTSTEDTNIKGANIHGSELTTLNVGGDLNIASVQDRSRSKNLSLGMSAGVSGSTEVTGANGGVNSSSGKGQSKETVLTSVTGGTLNVNVKGNTDLKGATLASGEYDEDGSFQGNSNFTLNTGSLTHSDLTNTTLNTQRSASLNSNVSFTEQSPNPSDPTTNKDESGTRINSSQTSYSNNIDSSKSKTLATLGEGEISIGGKEEVDATLNRDTTQTSKDIYSIDRTRGNIDLTVDNRLLTEDGRKAIKEDMERSSRLGESIWDVATKEAFELEDTFTHIDETQKDLDVQKQLALLGDGKYIEILDGKESTPEQKQEALNEYAKIYADVYGISIEEARVVATNEYIKGATHNQEDNNNIYINDEAQRNATDYAETMGHEVTHARINQGTTRDRAEGVDIETGHRLNEEYADTMGGYSADGLEFSSSNWNDYTVSQTSSNMHKENDTSLLMQENNQNFAQVSREHNKDMDYSASEVLDEADFIRKVLAKEEEILASGNSDDLQVLEEAKKRQEEINPNNLDMVQLGEVIAKEYAILEDKNFNGLLAMGLSLNLLRDVTVVLPEFVDLAANYGGKALARAIARKFGIDIENATEIVHRRAGAEAIKATGGVVAVATDTTVQSWEKDRVENVNQLIKEGKVVTQEELKNLEKDFGRPLEEINELIVNGELLSEKEFDVLRSYLNRVVGRVASTTNTPNQAGMVTGGGNGVIEYSKEIRDDEEGVNTDNIVKATVINYIFAGIGAKFSKELNPRNDGTVSVVTDGTTGTGLTLEANRPWVSDFYDDTSTFIIKSVTGETIKVDEPKIVNPSQDITEEYSQSTNSEVYFNPETGKYEEREDEEKEK